MGVIVVDLFSGLGGFSEAFVDKGHEVITVDWNRQFSPTICRDIRALKGSDLPYEPDLLVASPPCERFSVASIGRYWNGSISPLTEAAMATVSATVTLIQEVRPAAFLIENPMGQLRKLDLIPYRRYYTTLCRYGAGRMKPTDFWGEPPHHFKFRSPCKAGDWCHPSSPRSAHTGTQEEKRSPAEKAKLPYELSAALLRALELDRRELLS